MTDSHVTVHLVFPEPGLEQSYRAHILVEDISLADAAAVPVGEYDGELTPTTTQTVQVPVSSLDPTASYSVRVHVDSTGTGTVTTGDYLSTQSHPVLTHGHGDEVTVPLQQLS